MHLFSVFFIPFMFDEDSVPYWPKISTYIPNKLYSFCLSFMSTLQRAILCWTIWSCAILHRTILYQTVFSRTVMYRAVMHWAIMYWAVMYWAVISRAVMYWAARPLNSLLNTVLPLIAPTVPALWRQFLHRNDLRRAPGSVRRAWPSPLARPLGGIGQRVVLAERDLVLERQHIVFIVLHLRLDHGRRFTVRPHHHHPLLGILRHYLVKTTHFRWKRYPFIQIPVSTSEQRFWDIIMVKTTHSGRQTISVDINFCLNFIRDVPYIDY